MYKRKQCPFILVFVPLDGRIVHGVACCMDFARVYTAGVPSRSFATTIPNPLSMGTSTG